MLVDTSDSKIGLPPSHTGEYIFRTRFCENHYLDHITAGGTPKRWNLTHLTDECDTLGCDSTAFAREKPDFGNGKSLRGIVNE